MRLPLPLLLCAPCLCLLACGDAPSANATATATVSAAVISAGCATVDPPDISAIAFVDATSKSGYGIRPQCPAYVVDIQHNVYPALEVRFERDLSADPGICNGYTMSADLYSWNAATQAWILVESKSTPPSPTCEFRPQLWFTDLAMGYDAGYRVAAKAISAHERHRANVRVVLRAVEPRSFDDDVHWDANAQLRAAAPRAPIANVGPVPIEHPGLAQQCKQYGLSVITDDVLAKVNHLASLQQSFPYNSTPISCEDVRVISEGIDFHVWDSDTFHANFGKAIGDADPATHRLVVSEEAMAWPYQTACAHEIMHFLLDRALGWREGAGMSRDAVAKLHHQVIEDGLGWGAGDPEGPKASRNMSDPPTSTTCGAKGPSACNSNEDCGTYLRAPTVQIGSLVSDGKSYQYACIDHQCMDGTNGQPTIVGTCSYDCNNLAPGFTCPNCGAAGPNPTASFANKVGAYWHFCPIGSFFLSGSLTCQVTH